MMKFLYELGEDFLFCHVTYTFVENLEKHLSYKMLESIYYRFEKLCWKITITASITKFLYRILSHKLFEITSYRL